MSGLDYDELNSGRPGALVHPAAPSTGQLIKEAARLVAKWRAAGGGRHASTRIPENRTGGDTHGQADTSLARACENPPK